MSFVILELSSKVFGPSTFTALHACSRRDRGGAGSQTARCGTIAQRGA